MPAVRAMRAPRRGEIPREPAGDRRRRRRRRERQGRRAPCWRRPAPEVLSRADDQGSGRPGICRRCGAWLPVRPDFSEFVSYIRERPDPKCPHRSPTDSEVWSPFTVDNFYCDECVIEEPIEEWQYRFSCLECGWLRERTDVRDPLTLFPAELREVWQPGAPGPSRDVATSARARYSRERRRHAPQLPGARLGPGRFAVAAGPWRPPGRAMGLHLRGRLRRPPQGPLRARAIAPHPPRWRRGQGRLAALRAGRPCCKPALRACRSARQARGGGRAAGAGRSGAGPRRRRPEHRGPLRRLDGRPSRLPLALRSSREVAR